MLDSMKDLYCFLHICTWRWDCLYSTVHTCVKNLKTIGSQVLDGFPKKSRKLWSLYIIGDEVSKQKSKACGSQKQELKCIPKTLSLLPFLIALHKSSCSRSVNPINSSSFPCLFIWMSLCIDISSKISQTISSSPEIPRLFASCSIHSIVDMSKPGSGFSLF